MCAVDAAITAPQRGSIDCSADDVRAGAVEDRERLDALAEVLREDLLQARGVVVLAVGDLVAVVRGGDRGEHLGVDAGVVVGGEAAEGGVVERGSPLHPPSARTPRRRCSALSRAAPPELHRDRPQQRVLVDPRADEDRRDAASR